VVDLNSVTGSLLGVVHAFVIFCTKEEGYPLETSTDDRCFFSPAIDVLSLQVVFVIMQSLSCQNVLQSPLVQLQHQ